jgi:5-methylcytosine-specific restriction protein A
MPVTKSSGNLYLRLGRAPGPNHLEIVSLSELLNRLPWHSTESRNGTFRNPAGVQFKLLNIRSFERGHGFSHSATDAEVVTKYSGRPDEVARLAAIIRKAIDLDESERSKEAAPSPVEAIEWEFSEGRLLTSIHIRRERSSKVRRELLTHERRMKSWRAIYVAGVARC